MQNSVSLPVPTDDFLAFRVANFEEVSDWFTMVANQTTFTLPPEFGVELAAAPVFGESLRLLGSQIDQPTIRAGETFTFLTTWETTAVFPHPLVAFVHLTPDGAAIFGQQDWLDVRVSTLQIGDRFVQQHTLTVQPDAPVGEYHLQLGLYRPDTGERLLIGLDNGQTADRVWVGDVRIGE